MTPDPSRRARTLDFDDVMDAFFASYYRHRPVNATFIGVHEHDHRWPDLSEHGRGDRLADHAALRTRLERASAENPSGDGASQHGGPLAEIDRRTALGFLEIQDWELRSAHFERGNPSLYTGEAVFGVMGLFLVGAGSPGARPGEHLADRQGERERVSAAIARMDAIPDLLARGRENVRSAPSPWIDRAVRECDGALAFFTEGVDALQAAHGIDDPAFAAAADRARTAFSDHRAWLRADLSDRADGAYACGPAALAAYLEQGHFLDESAEEIARYAQEQLREAEARLGERPSDFGSATPDEALAGLRDVHPDAADYYARYQSIWDEVRALAETRGLLTWPDFPIRYVPRPVWSQAAAPHLYFLFYRSPPAFGRPRVHDYLVAPLPEDEAPAVGAVSEEDTVEFLRANNDSVIRLNHVIHHGGLGHHVQNWHAFRSESRIGRIAAVDCASRIAMFCGGTMAEGWACYATELAAEAGALTPLERYAELRSRARMAARAVVDVRLHHGEMTLDEAAAYYSERAGMSATAARGEAVKNSMFPGAALMYLVGTDAIRRLRGEMERCRGADFDLRAFHDEFLSYGSIPVTLIARDMLRSKARDERGADEDRHDDQ